MQPEFVTIKCNQLKAVNAMPAAKSKTELLSITDKEFVKLSKLIDSISEKQAKRKFEEDISIKDVVGHRAHWISLFLSWYKDGVAGKDVYFPAKGYKWSDLKKYNKQLKSRQRELRWDDVVSLLKKNHKKLIYFINSKSNSELYQGAMQGANNDWTVGRWAEAAGASHYRSAAKFIRACLREESTT